MEMVKRIEIKIDSEEWDMPYLSVEEDAEGDFCRSSDVAKLEQLLTEAVELMRKDCKRFEFVGLDPSLNVKNFLSKPEIKAIKGE
jgi:hypothetical protein